MNSSIASVLHECCIFSPSVQVFLESYMYTDVIGILYVCTGIINPACMMNITEVVSDKPTSLVLQVH